MACKKLSFMDYVQKHLTGIYSMSGTEECSLVMGDDGTIISNDVLDANYDIYDLQCYVCDLGVPNKVTDPKVHWEKFHQRIKE
jgi:hypothetical protein